MSLSHAAPGLPSGLSLGKGRAVIWKVLTIIGLILFLLIPMHMISGVLEDRQTTKNQVISEIANTWAGQQALLGPILAVPYQLPQSKTDKTPPVSKIVYLLPQQYHVHSNIQPEVRYRGIYQSVVYTSSLMTSGSFDTKPLQGLNVPPQNILWNRAFLVVGLSSPKGIGEKPNFSWAGQSLELLPGVNGTSFIEYGLYAPIALKAGQTNVPFKLSLSLKGSQSFWMTPIGKQNTFEVTSPWETPSFVGQSLPINRQINKQGFKAVWEIPYFSRNYNQIFTSDETDLKSRFWESTVGVELLSTIDSYRQSERATKYGILFLVLTFASYFLFEVIAKQRLHLFQYLLVGCAISLFYLLLVALSEVIPFWSAYALSSFSTIVALTLYSKAILGKVRRGAEWIIAGLLTILYGYLYILLQLEDYSLVFGAIGLFLVLTLIMYVTRNIDWYTDPISQ